MQADIERVRADSRQIVDFGDGMQKNEFFGALAQAMNFATIQPKLSQYCFIAVRQRPRKRWFNWFQHAGFLLL